MVKCPIPGCKSTLKDNDALYDHARKQHKSLKWNNFMAALVGGVACACGTLAKSQKGLKHHQSRSKCPADKESNQSDTDDDDDQYQLSDNVTITTPPTSSSSTTTAVDCNQLPQQPPISPHVGNNTPPPSTDISTNDPRNVIQAISASKLANMYGLRKVPQPLQDEFIECLERLCQTYIADSSDVHLYHIMALPKCGLISPEVSNKRFSTSKIKERLSLYPNIVWSYDWGENIKQFNTKSDTHQGKINKSKRYLSQGYIQKAYKCMLGGENASKIAPPSTDTFNKLQQLHPQSINVDFGNRKGTKPGILPPTIVHQCALDTPLYTGCGVSGWTSHMIHLAIQKSPIFLQFLHLLSQQIMEGVAPAKHLLCSSRLIPIIKDDKGGIRPIAVGELFYRIAMKSILKSLRNSKDNDLLQNQHGVGTPGGVEAIILRCQQCLNDHSHHGIGLVDIQNAFNTISRDFILKSIKTHSPSFERCFKWAYGEPTPLIIQGMNNHLMSCQGVRQGDPLAPYFFSLGFRNIIEQIQHSLPEIDVYSYLDDITLLCKQKQHYDQAIEIIKSFNDKGINIRQNKCIYESCQQIKQTKLELLGSCIGSLQGRAQFLTDKIKTIKQAMTQLDPLSSQEYLLIVRQCCNQQLRHLQRSMDSEGLHHLWQQLDDIFIKAIKHLRGGDDVNAISSKFQNQIIQLPLKYGGLGMISHSRTLDIVRESSTSLANAVLDWADTDNIQRSKDKLNEYHKQQQLTIIDQMSDEESRMFIDMSSKINRSWLNAIPCNNRLRVNDAEVAFYLKQKTLYIDSKACIKCGTPNIDCTHSDTCPRNHCYKIARHELIKKTLGRSLTTSGNIVNFEPFLCDKNDLRCDIKITGQNAPRGTSALLDISIVTLASSKNKKQTCSHQHKQKQSKMECLIQSFMEQRYQSKLNKYKPHTTLSIIPWIITTQGTLLQSTEQFTKQIKPMEYLLSELSVILIKTNYKSNTLTPINYNSITATTQIDNINNAFRSSTHNNDNDDDDFVFNNCEKDNVALTLIYNKKNKSTNEDTESDQTASPQGDTLQTDDSDNQDDQEQQQNSDLLIDSLNADFVSLQMIKASTTANNTHTTTPNDTINTIIDIYDHTDPEASPISIRPSILAAKSIFPRSTQNEDNASIQGDTLHTDHMINLVSQIEQTSQQSQQSHQQHEQQQDHIDLTAIPTTFKSTISNKKRLIINTRARTKATTATITRPYTDTECKHADSDDDEQEQKTDRPFNINNNSISLNQEPATTTTTIRQHPDTPDNSSNTSNHTDTSDEDYIPASDHPSFTIKQKAKEQEEQDEEWNEIIINHSPVTTSNISNSSSSSSSNIYNSSKQAEQSSEWFEF